MGTDEVETTVADNIYAIDCNCGGYGYYNCIIHRTHSKLAPTSGITPRIFGRLSGPNIRGVRPPVGANSKYMIHLG